MKNKIKMSIKEAKLEPRMEKLLKQFAFSELNQKDRNYVLSVLTEKQYQDFRKILLGAKSIFATSIEPSTAIKEKLEHAFQQQYHPVEPSLWASIFSYQIPAWQTAFAMASMLLFFLVKGNRIEEVIKEVPVEVYVYEKDTVYKELSMPFTVKDSTKKKDLDTIAQKTNVKPGEEHRTTERTDNYKSSIYREDNYLKNENPKNSIREEELKNYNQPVNESSLRKIMKDNPEIKEFLVKVY